MSQNAFSKREERVEPSARPVELDSDLYREIFDHSKEAIAIIDPEGFYLQQIGAHYTLLGYTDEKYIAPLYRQCLAHVFPSSYEGFGLTVLEAMACGAPTLTTAFSSLGEVAGDAALTLRELEVEPFALELRRLVSDQALQQDLRARGLAHARTFTWERCAAQTLGCYQRALDTES